MKDRFVEVSADADEKQEQQFDAWLEGKGIPFEGAEAETAYCARVTLMKEAIQLNKTPQRIPICPSAGFFPVQYSGVSMAMRTAIRNRL